MTQPTLVQLPAQPITPEDFRPYGQVIFASPDGKAYDTEDAQLCLDRGIPRFYIMQLHKRGRRFLQITRHQQCTQCLGSLQGEEWLIAVAPPAQLDTGKPESPAIDSIVAFRVPGNCFIKLAVGTWHAGPYFEQEAIEFYNLELSDTNITDHDTCNLNDRYGAEFEILL